MESWLDLARNSRTAANVLFTRDLFRSAISRAYYAVYSKVAWDLLNCGVSMPAGREGPNHKKLRTLIESNLISLNRERRLALSGLVEQLYRGRLDADYMPSAPVSIRQGRMAIGLMKKIFDAF